jgi:SAM-dependent methyltransferase
MERSIITKIYTKNGITKDNPFPNKKVLHVGCGGSKLTGAVGVDVLKLPAVDIVHDINKAPWPFPDNSFDILFAHSVVEHLGSIVTFLNEAYRVGKNGGRIIISVPYFRSIDSFSDPTHTHFFTSESLDYFLDDNNKLSRYDYTKIKFGKIGFWYGWPGESPNFIVRLFKKFIYSHKKFYDQYLSLLMPGKILTWELEIKK